MNFKIILFTCILFPVSLYGQILNVEKRRGEVEKNGWQGNLDFSAKYTQNTLSIFELYNKSTVNYKKDSVVYLILTDLKLIKKNSEDLINNGVIHLRRTEELKNNSAIKSEFFSQLQFNGVQKIKQRFLLGVAARLKLVGNDTLNFNISLGGMYEYEETTLETFHHALRLTSYTSFNWNIKDKWSLQFINYYQPKINKLNDYRLSNETSLSYQLTKDFSMVGIYNLLYDSNPVAEIPNTIYSAYLLFRYKF